MGNAAAKKGDKIKSSDTHNVVLKSNGSTAPRSFSFEGAIQTELSGNVKINGQFAAIVGSGADNNPSHNAEPDSFASAPSNKGEVFSGSNSVKINGKAAVRHGDKATTCTEPPMPGNDHIEVANSANANVFFGA